MRVATRCVSAVEGLGESFRMRVIGLETHSVGADLVDKCINRILPEWIDVDRTQKGFTRMFKELPGHLLVGIDLRRDTGDGVRQLVGAANAMQRSFVCGRRPSLRSAK